MYIEYPADIRLQHLIDTYWVSDGILKDPVSQRILPDGCVDIIFNFSGDQTNGKVVPEAPRIIGTMTTVLQIHHQPGQVQMIGIRFRPGGITAFTRMPVHEITDKHIPLDVADTLFDPSFYNALFDINLNWRLHHIDHYLTAKLGQCFIPDNRILHAASLVKNSHGSMSMRKLAQEACLSERQFERKFKSAVGITPKYFSKVVRFQYARHFLKSHPQAPFDTVASCCGYHDRSHLHKDFCQLGQFTPSELLP